MKTITQNLAQLVIVANEFQNLNEENLSVEFIDKVLDWINTDDKIVYSGLFESDKPNVLLSEYRKKLKSLKKLTLEKMELYNFEAISNLINRKIQILYKIFEKSIKKSQELYHKYIDLNGTLESWVYKYDNDSNEINNLKRELLEVENQYIEKQKETALCYKDFQKQRDDLFYLLDCNYNVLQFKIDNLIKILSGINIKTEEQLFKNNKDIIKVYDIFVGLKLIEYVDFFDFVFQLTQKDIFTLKKVKSQDKYIAYAILHISNKLISPKMIEIWQSKMVKKFEIKDFDKKNNPSENYKLDLHKEIDKILNEPQS